MQFNQLCYFYSKPAGYSCGSWGGYLLPLGVASMTSTIKDTIHLSLCDQRSKRFTIGLNWLRVFSLLASS